MSGLKLYVGWLREVGPAGPVDPGFGQPGGPVDPGYGLPGWSPVDPGFGFGGGLHPSHGLPGGGYPSHGLPGGGYPSHGLPIAPGHPGNKPPGRPILPPSVDNGLPPSDPPHIWGGGRWEILDPGFGKPPLLGLIPIDPGYGIPETPPPTAGTPLPKPPGGQWVPTDPDYGVSVCPPCGGKPHPPIWAWIPTPPDFSKPVPVPPAQPK
jgi:hypothetical protein